MPLLNECCTMCTPCRCQGEEAVVLENYTRVGGFGGCWGSFGHLPPLLMLTAGILSPHSTTKMLVAFAFISLISRVWPHFIHPKIDGVWELTDQWWPQRQFLNSWLGFLAISHQPHQPPPGHGSFGSLECQFYQHRLRLIQHINGKDTEVYLLRKGISCQTHEFCSQQLENLVVTANLIEAAFMVSHLCLWWFQPTLGTKLLLVFKSLISYISHQICLYKYI